MSRIWFPLLILQNLLLLFGCTAFNSNQKPLPAAYDIEEANRQYGRILTLHMLHGPFPHESRIRGHQHAQKYYAPEKHYNDDRSIVFIPHHFKAGRRLHLVFFFHGWYNSPEKVFKVYKVGEQFAMSAKNALLVVPAGPSYAPDSSGGKFGERGGFKRYLQELNQKLHLAGLGQIQPESQLVLSGHSGGYRVMADILSDPTRPTGICEVYLFDGLYNRHADFEKWITGQHGRFISLYTRAGGTSHKTNLMVERLQRSHVALLKKHADTVSLLELAGHRVLFLESDRNHRTVLNGARQLTLLLATGHLPDVSLTGDTGIRQ